MKVDKIIFGCDDNPDYLFYWEINARVCREVLEIEPVLFWITDEDSDFYHDGHGLVKKIKKLPDHLWNGITTDYFGKVCHKIISDDIHQNGIFHIFSEYDVTKAELLHLFNKKWNLELNIEEISSGSSIDRTLRTHKDFNSFLNLPGIDKMIEEL